MAVDYSVKIVKSDGSLGTTDKADTSTAWPSTDTYITYGGSSDLWGETWTAEDINDADFGVVFSGNDQDIRPIHVDHIRITVYYTEVTTTSSSTTTTSSTTSSSTTTSSTSTTTSTSSSTTSTSTTTSTTSSTSSTTTSNTSSSSSSSSSSSTTTPFPIRIKPELEILPIVPILSIERNVPEVEIERLNPELEVQRTHNANTYF